MASSATIPGRSQPRLPMPFQSHKKPFILDPKKSARKAYEYAVYDDDFEPSGEDEESFRVVTNHV